MLAMLVLQVLVIVALTVTSNGQDVSQLICSVDRSSAEYNTAGANVIIGGIMEIRDIGQGSFGCGRPTPALMQVFEAARYAINYINNNYIPGVKFGLRVYDTCLSSTNALRALQKLYPQSTANDPYCNPAAQVVTAGIIGPLSSITSVPVADLARSLSVSLISPRAMTPELSDKFKYPTFLRTIPSNSVFSKVVVELLQHMQWENVLVVYTDDAYGRSGYTELLQAAFNRGLCMSQAIMLDSSRDKATYRTALSALGSNSFSAAVLVASNNEARVVLEAIDEVPVLADTQWILSDLDMSKDVSGLRRVRGALVVYPGSPTVDEFRDYFTQLEGDPRNNLGNPWFEDWYEETYSCSLRGGVNACPTVSQAERRARFTQSPWAVSTIAAVFAYAEAVRSICPSSGGVCNGLLNTSPSNFHQILANLDYTFPSNFGIAGLRGYRIKFDANGDPEAPMFTVYNYNNRLGGNFAFESIGSFVSDNLSLNREPVLYDSTRSNEIVAPTARCLDLGCDNCLLPQQAVSLRYTPGDLVIASLVDAHLPGKVAFACGEGVVSRLTSLVAAEWAVSQYKQNNPNKLAGVSLGSLVADICPNSLVTEGFLTDLLSGNNRLVDQTGAVIMSSNIQAFIDQTGSDQAKMISPILSQSRIPEIQTSALTSMLSGSDLMYFSRAVPDDDTYFSAIANLLLHLNWNYVQVATHSSGFYYDQSQMFQRIAALYSICITNVANFDSTYEAAYKQLESNSRSDVVVVIGGVSDLQGLLTEKARLGSTTFQFVAGVEEWSRDPELLQGLGSSANDIIVLDLELQADSNFNNWLRSRSSSGIGGNEFMRELFEISNQCSLIPDTSSQYTRTCNPGETFNIQQGKAPYVIQSIYTVADKLHEVIVEVCQDPNYIGLCSEFRSTLDIGSRLDAKIRNSGPTVNGFEIKEGEGMTDYVIYTVRQGVYVEIGRFDATSRQLTNMNLTPLGNYQDFAATCAGACVECQYLYSLQGRYFLPGDWIIAGIFSVSNPGPSAVQPYICGDTRIEDGPQYTTAMMYAIDRINKGLAPVSVRGTRFGALVMDHCDNTGRTELMVSDVYSGFFTSGGVDQSKILTWLTDTTPSTNEAAALLTPLNVAMVSPSATSAGLLSHPTFYRTVQGDATAATALIKVVKSLGFPYVQVIYASNAYGLEGFSVLQIAADQEGICITNNFEYSSSATNADDLVSALLQSESSVVIVYLDSSDTRSLLTAVIRSQAARESLLILLPEPHEKVVEVFANQLSKPMISLQFQQSTLTEYYAYLATSPTDNPYFVQYYMKVKRCKLPGYTTYATECRTDAAGRLIPITEAEISADNFLLATINAVYASVDALDRTLREYCGTNYTEPCVAFLQSDNKRQRYNELLNSANFIDDGQNNYRFLEREGNVAYDIVQTYNNNGIAAYRKVGRYAGVSLDLDETLTAVYADVQSLCATPCLGCIVSGLNFSYTAGDIYIAGLFDVHQRSLSPFTCGGINTLHGFLLLEAFHYALNQVNEKKGQFANILTGTRLGGIGLDACDSQIRGGYLVSNINNGRTILSRDGVNINPYNIDAYLGSYDSTASMYLARILNDLEVPQISFASPSTLLNDERIYPYFYRTVPSDENQILAMLKFMDQLNIRYVQILYEDSTNGVTSRNSFERMAGDYNICVAQSVVYEDVGIANSETSNLVVTRLVEKPAANTVVTFLGTSYINSILHAVGRSSRARSLLRFVGSDAWADNQEAIEGAGQYAIDSITVKLDSDDVKDFESYINSKTLANSDENPWFEEYYQEIHNCYTSKANTRGYPSQCPLTPSSTINSLRYQQDPGVVYVMNAVYAAAFGIHETLKSSCGADYTTVCQAYLNNVQRRNTLLDKLANVRFTDPVGNQFYFQDRQGVASYRFNTIKPGIVGGVNYDQIGSYNSATGEVTVSNSYSSQWNSNCDRKDACAECPAIRDQGVRYHLLNSATNIFTNATTVVAFFDIHEQGVDPYRCGKLNMEGFNQFLAFLYSAENLFLGRISSTSTGSTLSNGLRILAVDTCSNSLRVDQDLFGLLQGNGLCNTDFDSQGNAIGVDNIGSVITLGELNTIAASRVLEGPGITYVSPNARTTVLDDRVHLARTISPISAQMYLIVSLLEKLELIFVDVIYENAMDAVRQWEKFAYYANMKSICHGTAQTLNTDVTLAQVEDLLRQLSGSQGSRVVVLMGTEQFIRNVIRIAVEIGVAENYIWLVATEWDVEANDVANLAPSNVQLKMITVHRLTDSVSSFARYVSNLRYVAAENDRNLGQVPRDWWEEFYQTYHNCVLTSAIKPINIGKRECTQSEMIPLEDVNQDPYTLNTIAAMYAVTEGLRRYCNPAGGCTISPSLNNMNARNDIKNSILGVTWDMLNSDIPLTLENGESLMLQFNNMRWWDSGYEILFWSMQRNSLVATTMWDQGVFDPSTSDIQDMKRIVNVTSACNENEEEGFCGCTFQIIGTPEAVVQAPFQATDHRNYYEYDNEGKQRYNWPVWAIAVAVATCVGILVAFILFLILLCAYPKRGGTSVLGYMVIVGIIGIYAINFAFFLHADSATCGARRFLMGVMYAIVFAALLIKAIDNWRFGHVEYAPQRYSGISSAVVLFLCAIGIVLIQCIIPIMWLILVHPTASLQPVLEDRHDNWWCDPPEDYDLGLVLSFAFVMFIVLLTGIFSALAYDTDRNNFESRWILFGSIATAGCFLVWMIVSTNAGPPFRDPAVAIANCVNASLLLAVVPIRKTILMCRALHEKNEEKEAMEVVNGQAHYDVYSSSYANPTFELGDYDNQFADNRPSEF